MTKQICIRLTDEEYEYISNNAEQLDISTTAYVKQLAMYQNIINYNYDAIEEHTKQIIETKKVLNDILHNIIINGETYKGDFQTIIQQINQLSASENALLTVARTERNKRYDYIRRRVDRNFEKLKNDSKDMGH